MKEFLSIFALENIINICVYLAMAAVFVFAFLRCVLPVWHTRAILRRAVKSLRQGEKSRRSWQDDKFLGRGALYPHWSEYLDNLFFADGEYHNASNVEDYINEDTVINQPGSGSVASAVPGIMVSLGFLGTLLGITQGLSGFSMESSETVMEAIRTLVPGMRYAFSTSIAGVIGSMLFTLCTGAVNGATRSVLNSFYAAMHKDAGVLTVDPLNQIAIYQQEQTAQIQKITEAVTVEMSKKLGATMTQAVRPLAESVDSFCRFASQEQTQALDTVVARFVERMDAVLQGQLRALAGCIDETVRRQERTFRDTQRVVEGIGEMQVNIGRIQKASEDVMAGFGAYVSKLNAAQNRADEMYTRMSTSADMMEKVTREQSSLLSGITALQQDSERTVAEQQKAAKAQLDAMLAEIAKLRESLESAAKVLRESGESLTESHKAFVTGVNEDLEKTYNAFFNDIGETTKKLQWMTEDVKAAMDRLPDAVNEAANIFVEQGDRLADIVERAAR